MYGLPYDNGKISIHTLRMEGDVNRRLGVPEEEQFQSTPSAWRVTLAGFLRSLPCIISIHTLRMEGDVSKRRNSQTTLYISIHTLRMEGDLSGCRASPA